MEHISRKIDLQALLKQKSAFLLGPRQTGKTSAIKKQLPDFFITESEINKDPDQRNYIVSNEKLEATGWKPTFSLDDTIREVIQACPIIKNTNCPFSDI